MRISGSASPMRSRDEPASTLELFFDLVVVFAFTQVTTFLSQHPTWGGIFKGSLLLAMVWWAWSAYAWLTNHLDPEQGYVRLVVLLGMAAMLIVSLALPSAFGRDGEIFAVSYLVVRALHFILLGVADRTDQDLVGAVLRVIPAAILGPVLLVVAGLVGGSVRLTLWCAAVAVTYLGAMFGGMRGWRVSPGHFVERFGLIIIIALGESVVAIGVGARDLALTWEVLVAAGLGITVIACLWWSYFDWAATVARWRLTQATERARAVLARDAYSYLHLPMVAGIVLFSFGLMTTLAHPHRTLSTEAAFGLAAGLACYISAHVAVRVRIGGGLGRGRPIAALLLLALLPAAWNVPALAALSMVTAICVGLIAYEYFAHRDVRAQIRSGQIPDREET